MLNQPPRAGWEWACKALPFTAISRPSRCHTGTWGGRVTGGQQARTRPAEPPSASPGPAGASRADGLPEAPLCVGRADPLSFTRGGPGWRLGPQTSGPRVSRSCRLRLPNAGVPPLPAPCTATSLAPGGTLCPGTQPQLSFRGQGWGGLIPFLLNLFRGSPATEVNCVALRLGPTKPRSSCRGSLRTRSKWSFPARSLQPPACD